MKTTERALGIDGHIQWEGVSDPPPSAATRLTQEPLPLITRSGDLVTVAFVIPNGGRYIDEGYVPTLTWERKGASSIDGGPPRACSTARLESELHARGR